MKRLNRLTRLLMASAISVAAFAPAVSADPLRIAIGGAFTSMDPHFYNATPNHTVAMHIFDRLIDRRPDTSLAPALALSWEAVSDTEWLFHLRDGVTWHDGEPFTADDVAFTYTRARDVPNSPGGFGGFLREVESVEVIDDLTLKITTPVPAPNLPRNLAFVPIISRHVGETATTEDYNAGTAVIGTGPYRFVSYAPSDRVEYARNDDWWGEAQPWDTVTLRMIPSAGARVAALLSGDVDVIDTPPSGDLERLRSDDNLAVYSTPGMRVMYVGLNQTDSAPGVSGPNGEALDTNPLQDPRVRRALSLAINREGLATRLMQGAAVPTGQWLSEGQFSYAPSVEVPPYDVAAAQALLAEAGYPDGFTLPVFGPNDRYPGDAATTQALAQMWARLGLRTSVDSQPWSTYSGITGTGELSVGLLGWGSPTGEAGYLLTNVLHTRDADAGTGIFNTGRYSNPELDALVDTAMATLDDAEREALLIQAVEMVDADTAMIPLFMLINNWATRSTVTIDARRDERTLAIDIHPAQ
ncbi:ABC transporter substrate-binding protein [Pararhodobacter zhoushanensis]|uniref:ABC transporter substrate-binding protein n=1 Tax=Pararhodobacter zhoushanensis TaxID=2479545 RepID=UPI000F8C3EC0|nr:ABC transporter substrate-binding protein [Pararhodobacter zhoushanensis]